MQNYTKIQVAIESIKKKVPDFTPKIAIILGTGLSDLETALANFTKIKYEDIPNFPISTVASHKGCLLFGKIENVDIVIQQGRCHLYEGYSPSDVCTGLRIMQGLGAKSLIITNAAGALNPLWQVGELMLICDHINHTGYSPLTGTNHDVWGDRFPDMSCAYDLDYIDIAQKAALDIGLNLEKGVYIGVAGPQYETPAETRFFKQIGADAVGMSTVLEVISARHLGMKVLGISCLTNKNLPDCMIHAPLDSVIAVAQKASANLIRLIRQCLPKL